MKEFESYFTYETIIEYLCKLRAKVAKSRSKKHLLHLLTDSHKYNYHVNDLKEKERQSDFEKLENSFIDELNRMFPSRKKWVSLGGKARKNKNTKQPISAFDRNYLSLIKTVKTFKKNSPELPWLNELDNFVEDIQESISSGRYQIKPPVVYPKLKDPIKFIGTNLCRPISMYTLKDRIILSLTNRYLTCLFDGYFENCSYAFRSKRNEITNAVVTHHDCIKAVINFRSRHNDTPLWVVECDMEKFYDSVNHEVVLRLFKELVQKAKQDNRFLNLDNASHIFCQYLNSYAFNVNVPQKTDLTYWESYNIPNGEFGWVEDGLKTLGYYGNIDTERIGVPQGGALSGLIANIVLDVADKNVLKNEVFYVRFCDDMLIMHPDRDLCEKAKKDYVNSLQELKLVPHDFSTVLCGEREKEEGGNLSKRTFKPFWKSKSKGPYKWSSIVDEGYPWIGFVGYEINYNGLVRVRKKSLTKELEKQEKVIQEIRSAVKSGRRKSVRSVTESAIHRLVGMSVGRVTIRNYDVVSNDLCWKNGFKELNKNKYSIAQIKQLDRNRNKLYYAFVQEMRDSEFEDDTVMPSKPRPVIHFNKPFSYFYQVLERES